MNSTQKVQRIMLYMPLKEGYSIVQIANMAGVRYGIAKKTLHTARCIEVKRTGGPRAYRKEKAPKTISKLFDATTEAWQEQGTPIKCRGCRFANTGLMQTMFRNKDTVSGCLILNQRKTELAK